MAVSGEVGWPPLGRNRWPLTRCDLHRSEISLIERGGREPRLGTLIKLAAALDTDLDALLTPPDATASR